MISYRQVVKPATPNNISNIVANEEKKRRNKYDKLTESVLPFCCDLFLVLFWFVCLLVLIYPLVFRGTFRYLKASPAAVFQLHDCHRFIF